LGWWPALTAAEEVGWRREVLKEVWFENIYEEKKKEIEKNRK
jgi:hypothetical protein